MSQLKEETGKDRCVTQRFRHQCNKQHLLPAQDHTGWQVEPRDVAGLLQPLGSCRLVGLKRETLLHGMVRE